MHHHRLMQCRVVSATQQSMNQIANCVCCFLFLLRPLGDGLLHVQFLLLKLEVDTQEALLVPFTVQRHHHNHRHHRHHLLQQRREVKRQLDCGLTRARSRTPKTCDDERL